MDPPPSGRGKRSGNDTVNDNAATRHGFRWETELCANLAEALGAGALPTRESARSVVLSEVQVEAVVPDLVAVAFQSAEAESGDRVRSLRGFECAVLAELLVRNRTSRTLAERLWSREATVNAALDRLAWGGLVTRQRSGTYRLAEAAFRGAYVIAIEAKLRRWADAVEQARSYQSFANRAFVALPAGVAERNAALAATCRKAGIGLLSVSATGVRVVLRGRYGSPRSRGWVWVVAKALADPPASSHLDRRNSSKARRQLS